MAGYWPSSFFWVFIDRHEVERHKHAKKERRPVSSHLNRKSLINKGFIIMYNSLHILTFLNGCISLKIGSINTKLSKAWCALSAYIWINT